MPSIHETFHPWNNWYTRIILCGSLAHFRCSDIRYVFTIELSGQIHAILQSCGRGVSTTVWATDFRWCCQSTTIKPQNNRRWSWRHHPCQTQSREMIHKYKVATLPCHVEWQSGTCSKYRLTLGFRSITGYTRGGWLYRLRAQPEGGIISHWGDIL